MRYLAVSLILVSLCACATLDAATKELLGDSASTTSSGGAGSGSSSGGTESDKDYAEKKLAEEMGSLSTSECGKSLKTSIDWPSFGNTTEHYFSGEHGSKISIGGSCDVSPGLAYFCKKHGADAIADVKQFVCALRKKDDDPFFKEYGFSVGVDGDTMTLFTNLEPLNLNDHFDEYLAANLKNAAGLTYEEAADRLFAEKQLAEGMARLSKNGCPQNLETSIDWASFGGTAKHFFSGEHGSRISIGGSCDIHTGYEYYCKKNGPAKISKFKKFQCRLHKSDEDPFFKQYGFKMAVEGDTLVLYTNLEPLNLNDHVDEWMKANLK